MPKFAYKAKKGLKGIVEGVIEQPSRDAAVEKLINSGLTPINIVLQAETVSIAPPKTRRLNPGRISSKELTIFTRQLHTLIKSRVELLSSLKILQEQQGNLFFKEIIQDLSSQVRDGASFSRTLTSHPETFSRLYANIIVSGEASGDLSEALDQLCVYLERIEDLRLKLRQALAYPCLMIGVGMISIFVLVTFVVPRLSAMFNNLDIVLPWPTRVLIRSGAFLKSWWWVVIIFLVSAVYFYLRFGADKKQDNFLVQLKFHLPIIGKLAYKQAMVNFTTTLSLLLRSGVALFEALRISAPLLEDRRLVEELDSIREKVKVGSSLSQGLEASRSFPSFLVQMIRVGEESGRLEEVIFEIAGSVNQELESDLKIFSSLIEPLIILIIGAVVGAIVISMLLPIFEINMLAR
jgi:general secretion pathway protein F